MCPKEKLFKGYVQLERDLGEIDRCRKVYRRVLCAFVSFAPPALSCVPCHLLRHGALKHQCSRQSFCVLPCFLGGKSGMHVFSLAKHSSPRPSFLLSRYLSSCVHRSSSLPLHTCVNPPVSTGTYVFLLRLEFALFFPRSFLLLSSSKCLEAFPSDCGVWAQFAALEGSVGETERSRAVFELAIRQPVLDMPETLWKAYIDFEVGWLVGWSGEGIFGSRAAGQDDGCCTLDPVCLHHVRSVRAVGRRSISAPGLELLGARPRL